MCREDAREISSRFASGEFAGAKLYGVIKEVAPVKGSMSMKGAETDKELGVEVFQTEYFGSNELFIDQEKEFHKFLGGKSILSQPLHSWNPFTIYQDFKALGSRLKEKKLEGNMNGEGLMKGGFLIVHPVEGVVYRHEESIGTVMPMDEIREALRKMSPEAYEGKAELSTDRQAKPSAAVCDDNSCALPSADSSATGDDVTLKPNPLHEKKVVCDDNSCSLEEEQAVDGTQKEEEVRNADLSESVTTGTTTTSK